MAIFLELFNWAILIALIIFSAWSFYLQYKADRVTTTKDLLLAYVTGGALAVVTMVFGVTGDIVKTSDSIKLDTVSIRETLERGTPLIERPERADPPIISADKELAALLEFNRQQTQLLRSLLTLTGSAADKVGQNRQLLERILETSGTNPNLVAKLSGSQLFIQLNLFCTVPTGDEGSNCVVVPNER